MTQPGMSRMIARLEAQGSSSEPTTRTTRGPAADPPHPGRRRSAAARGAAHGRHVAAAMTRALSREQLVLLRDLCHELGASRP